MGSANHTKVNLTKHVHHRSAVNQYGTIYGVNTGPKKAVNLGLSKTRDAEDYTATQDYTA